jgi:ubiquinone/menaquinone biosynthesis C-methylase UbiE
MGMERQGAKPTGRIGRLIGILMNQFHTDVYMSYLEGRLPPDNSAILDIGCGGGSLLHRLSRKNCTYKLLGVDHSPEMVELSRRVNRNKAGVEGTQVTIVQASVRQMPIESDSIDLVTAFETIQFWPDMDKSLAEVRRVLRSSGTLLIINRYPREGSKWWKMAQIKSAREYAEKLERAGFARVVADLSHKKGWIAATATKLASV